MRQVKAAVISNNEIMPGVHLIWLDCSPLAPPAQPGQFVMVRCGEGLEYQLRRPLSIHQLNGKKLALLFNVVGKGTRWLSQCQAGDEIDLLGALGNDYSINPGSHNLLLVAGGIGITPLVFLAQQVLNQGCSVTLLLGAPTASQLHPGHLLPSEVKLFTATEDGSEGEKGIITNVISKHIDWADQIFACGPLSMYQTMARMPELRNKPIQISLEVRMGCGLGICYGCTVKTKSGLKQVCKDGPIFDLDDILWEELSPI